MQEKTVVPNVLSDCEYQNWGGGGGGGREGGHFTKEKGLEEHYHFNSTVPYI